MRPFALPDIGEGLDEAEIVRWLVEVGDEVRRDQPLVEVETDKAVAELPAPVAGRIARIVVAVGARVAVGTVLVEIDDGAEVTAPAPSTATTTVRTTTAAMTTVVEPPSDRDRRGRVLASPATRKLAVEMGIDLGDIAGTGPGGRVSSDDVRAKVRPRTPSAPARLPAADRGPASHPGVAMT